MKLNNTNDSVYLFRIYLVIIYCVFMVAILIVVDGSLPDNLVELLLQVGLVISDQLSPVKEAT